MFKFFGILLLALLLGIGLAWEPLLCSRREDVLCPVCGREARVGKHWACDCGHGFDTFAHRGRCPSCRLQWQQTMCGGCRQWSQHERWYVDALARRPGRELNVQARGNQARCPFCHGDLPRRDHAVCATCAAPHHRDCWSEHGRCASCVNGRRKAA